MRSADIFISDRAPDGGFVDPHVGGDFGHGEGVEGGGAAKKIVGLAMGNDFEKFLEGFLSAFERLHKKARGSNSFFEVGAGLFVGGGVAEEVFVDIADTEAGQNISFQKRDPLIAVADERGFGADDKVEAVGGEGGARARGKAGDDLGGGGDGLEGGMGGGGDFREFTFS